MVECVLTGDERRCCQDEESKILRRWQATSAELPRQSKHGLGGGGRGNSELELELELELGPARFRSYLLGGLQAESTQTKEQMPMRGKIFPSC